MNLFRPNEDEQEEGQQMFEDYESIDDIARGEGFFIDDDGHWIPLEDADEYDRAERYFIDEDGSLAGTQRRG